MPHAHQSKDDKQVANWARFAGSGAAGALEIITFHPFDTVAKRLMSNQEKVFGGGKTPVESLKLLHDVIFRKSKDLGMFRKYLALFPGIGFGAAYKVLQRVYKFGGQPIVNDFVNKHSKQDFIRVFGVAGAKPWMQAVSGAMIGIGEVVLLPLDVLKIKQQTNPEALQGRGIFKLIKDENFKLYRGTLVTAARNAPGSFALFGGNAVSKEFIFKLEDYNKATFFQNGVSSVIGSVSSVVVSCPLDVIKTRIQNRNFDNPESAMSVVTNLLRNEGPSALFKGVVPKTMVVAPKLIFSFTVAQSLITYFDAMGDESKLAKEAAASLAASQAKSATPVAAAVAPIPPVAVSAPPPAPAAAALSQHDAHSPAAPKN